jgi:hypothetical protein
MGEIAEMMLDGTLCESCGIPLNDDPPGYPCMCAHCHVSKRIYTAPAKVKCPVCKKKVKHNGLADHVRDAHTNKPAHVPRAPPPKGEKTISDIHFGRYERSIYNDWKNPKG